MVSNRAQVRTHRRSHPVERVAFGAYPLEDLSAAGGVTMRVQGGLICLQDLLALGGALFKQGACLLAHGRIAIHEEPRLIGVELPGLNISAFYRVEQQASAVRSPSQQCSRRFGPDLGTHLPPLRQNGTASIWCLAGAHRPQRSYLNFIGLSRIK